MQQITALILRMTAVLITLSNFGFSAGVAPTLMMSSRQNWTNYFHIFLGPSLLILVSLIVAFNANRIARFVCSNDENISFGNVDGRELARIAVSILGLFIIVYAIVRIIGPIAHIILSGMPNTDDFESTILYSRYVGLSVRFLVELILGIYLFRKSNYVAGLISKNET